MKKIFTLLLFLLLVCSVSQADEITPYYRFFIPSRGSQDWDVKLSNDILSGDRIIYHISQDTIASTLLGAIISNERSIYNIIDIFFDLPTMVTFRRSD